jgi:asparagine synthase (glutamine-hydrolysing)
MCGIVGIRMRGASRDRLGEIVSAMCGTIVHRGPDDQGMLVDEQAGVGIGMRRLSIIDLAGGHQPIGNEDGTIHVVFNGEIFNYPELQRELRSLGHVFKTRSDTEVLVHGYEEWGDALPARLNGMFGFSIWDSRRNRLLLARDHVGIKPLYIYEDQEKVAWASEIKALLAVPGIRGELDPAALMDFLSLGYVPAPHTMFRGIHKIPAASRVVIEQGSSRVEPYWDLGFPHEHRSADEWCEEVRHLVDDSIQRQLMSDVPLGAFLSGGVDSSAIVATMKKLGVEKVSTYSIGFGGADAFHSELSDAAATAREFGTDHHEILVAPDVAELLPPLIHHLDEPVTDTSFLVTYLVSKLARESVKVILSGVGGDEVFAGYRRYLGPRIKRLYGVVPRAMHRRVLLPMVRMLPVDRGSSWKSRVRYVRGFLESAEMPAGQSYQSHVGIFGSGLAESLLTADFASHVAGYESDRVAHYFNSAPTDDPLNRMMYADLKTSLVDSLLAFSDKMSMAVSLEARVPLLDYRLVELAARIPTRLKLRGWRGLKHIFKRAMRDRLPASVLNRKKRGFGTPISRWFRGDLKPLLGEMLAPERIASRGYFRPEAVARLVDDHMQQRADRSEHLLALLTFEIWHQTFLDGKR